MAPTSAASRDMTVKIVVPTAGSLVSTRIMSVASNTPLARFLRTVFQGKYWPFIAT